MGACLALLKDGRLEVSLVLSVLILPASTDSRVGLSERTPSSKTGRADAVEGREGGDGGAPLGVLWMFLGETEGTSNMNGACACGPDGSDRCIFLPRGSENLE